MEEKSTELRIKVVIGEGSNQIMKRLSKVPTSYKELQEMVFKRFKERLAYCENANQYKYYYKDLYNGMINISDSNELRLAVDYFKMYDIKCLRIYGKSFI